MQKKTTLSPPEPTRTRGMQKGERGMKNLLRLPEATLKLP